MELSGKVGKNTKTENRNRKLTDAVENIRSSSPEFTSADKLARNNPDS